MHAEHAARCARDEPEHEAAACHEAEHERKDEIVAGARRDDARLVRVRLRLGLGLGVGVGVGLGLGLGLGLTLHALMPRPSCAPIAPTAHARPSNTRPPNHPTTANSPRR